MKDAETVKIIRAKIIEKQAELQELENKLKTTISTKILENWNDRYIGSVKTDVKLLDDKKILLERTYFGMEGEKYTEAANIGWPYAYLEIETLKKIVAFLTERGVL